MTVYELDLDRVGESPEVVIRHLRGECGTPKNCPWLHAIADQIEAQTKPPRIPEPGLWGVVEAEAKGVNGNTVTARKRWVRDEQGWIEVAGNGWRVSDFKYLVDPVLVREGVRS